MAAEKENKAVKIIHDPAEMYRFNDVVVVIISRLFGCL